MDLGLSDVQSSTWQLELNTDRFKLKTPPCYTPHTHPPKKKTNKQNLQILEALNIKINKPFLNKINLEYNSQILKCL